MTGAEKRFISTLPRSRQDQLRALAGVNAPLYQKELEGLGFSPESKQGDEDEQRLDYAARVLEKVQRKLRQLVQRRGATEEIAAIERVEAELVDAINGRYSDRAERAAQSFEQEQVKNSSTPRKPSVSIPVALHADAAVDEPNPAPAAPARNGPADDGLTRALELAQLGCYVFPSQAKNRHPTAWPQKATRDAEALTKAWSHGHQPSISTGKYGEDEALLVVDVDPRHDGDKSLEALELVEGPLPPTRTHRTPSGGEHRIYRMPAPGVKSGANVLGQGLDIRSAGGLIHFGNGYSVASAAPIALAPAWLIAACKTQAKPVPAAPSALDGVVHEGGRNDLLSREAYRLIRRGLDPAAIGAVISAMNQAVCSPPLDDDEVRAIAEGKAKIKSEALEIVESFDDLGEAPAESTAPKFSVITYMLRTAADIDRAALLRPDYLIKGWLDRAANAVLFGEWNTFKTFVTLNMCVHIAAGMAWFGCRVKQAPVLYLTYEGGRKIDKRMAGLRMQFPDLDWSKLPLAWQVLHYPLTTKEGRDELQTAVKAFHARFGAAPGLVVIDPLMDALGGDDSDAELMAKLNTLVHGLIASYSCAVLRVHHSGHSDKTRSRGHSSLPASADTEIKIADGTITATKQRDDLKGQLTFKHVVVELGVDQDGDRVTTCIIEAGAQEGRSTREGAGPVQKAVMAAARRMADVAALAGTSGGVTVGDVIHEAIKGLAADPNRLADPRRGNVTRALNQLAGAGLLRLDSGMVHVL